MIPFDEALAALKNCDCPEEKIIQSSIYRHPLQQVYVKMVENGDLVRLTDLPEDQKRRYWNQVKHLENQTEEWILKQMCQALYCYEVIK